MQIESVPIESLIPYARNARTHSEEQVAQIAGSIREFGFTNPVLIDGQDGIIAGHGRVLGARKLGMSDVPCIRLAHLSEAQKRAYVIADNKLALNAGWDEKMLALELQDLQGMDFDLSLTGFLGNEIDELLAELDATPEGATDADETPPVQAEAITKQGDVWLLGKHRIMCGDSTSAADVARLMDGGKVDMVFTDPPYGMFLDTDYDSMFATDKKHRKTGKRFSDVAGDHDDFAPELIRTIFTAVPDAKEVFIWGADYFSDLIPNRKDGSWVVWDKRTNENMDKVSGNTFELCWSKQKHKRLIARILWSGHHGMAKDDTKTRVHPTQKPVELVSWFFHQWGNDCKSVADLFSGSGTTIIAAEQTGRRCYAMELSPQYVDVAVRRWQQYTGKQAVHSVTGKSFDETAAVNAQK